MLAIQKGDRENIIDDTPIDYSYLYTSKLTYIFVNIFISN